jgi:hypothetical protein
MITDTDMASAAAMFDSVSLLLGEPRESYDSSYVAAYSNCDTALVNMRLCSQ